MRRAPGRAPGHESHPSADSAGSDPEETGHDVRRVAARASGSTAGPRRRRERLAARPFTTGAGRCVSTETSHHRAAWFSHRDRALSLRALRGWTPAMPTVRTLAGSGRAADVSRRSGGGPVLRCTPVHQWRQSSVRQPETNPREKNPVGSSSEADQIVNSAMSSHMQGLSTSNGVSGGLLGLFAARRTRKAKKRAMRNVGGPAPRPIALTTTTNPRAHPAVVPAGRCASPTH